MEAFDAPATVAPATLPAAFVEATLATRPVLAPGGQPGAVVVLLEFEVKGGGA
jgi:hypothetical protein